MGNSNNSVKTFHLELESELLHVSDVLKSVLHTILFHRIVHIIGVKETSILGINYCYLDDEKVVQDVNKIIKIFHQSIDPNLKHGTFENVVTINLFEKKNSGNSGIWPSGGGEGGNGILWEKWSIKVNVYFAENEKETNQFRLLAEKQLRACLLYISSLNITEIYHLPFLKDDKIVHSYKIIVQNTNNSDSWTGLLKKMISDSAIPSILK